jgi:hypothetical protein
LKDLLPWRVLDTASAIGNELKAATIGAAQKARRAPMITSWVRSGRRLKLLNIALFKFAPSGGIYFETAGAGICTGDLPCRKQIDEGL